MVTASFKEGQKTAITTSLQKYDYGEVLRIKGLSLPRYVAVQFAVDGMSEALPSSIGETVEDVTDVLIPNSLLRSNIKPWNYNIMAYVYIVSGSSGKTEYTITIPVKWRPKTGDDQAADDDVVAVIGSAVEKMNTATTKAENAANQASATAEEIKADREKITTNEIKIAGLKSDKVDYVQNLAAVSKLKRDAALDATSTINDDGSITVVPKASYGRYDFEYALQSDGKEKTFYFSANLKSENTTQVISSSIYCYNGYTNLRELKKIATQTTLNGTVHNISQICRYKDTQYNTNKIVIGLMTNTGIEYTVTKKSMLLIDITELAETITVDDRKTMQG